MHAAIYRGQINVGLLILAILGNSNWAQSQELPGPESPVEVKPLCSKDRPSNLIVLRLSQAMVSSQINRKIDCTLPVRDVILGTPVTGTARMVGEPVVKLEPSDDHARFNVVFTGTVYSKTIANGGPVLVYGHSITRFTACQAVVFEPGKGFESKPSTIAANTQCFTDSIRAKRGGIIGRITERRAADEVASKRSAVTAIARDRASRRVSAAFERFMEERLAKLNQSVEFQTRLAELRTRDGNRRLIARTTSDYLEIADAIFYDNGPIDRPDFSAVSHNGGPIQIWVHSSVVPPAVATALETIFTNPDQSAVVNSLALLPGALSKKAASAITAFASENKVAVQNTSDWFVIEMNAENASRVAATPAVGRALR